MHTLVLPLLLLLSPLLPFASPHPQPSALSSPPKYLISDCGPLTSHVSHALDRAVLALPAAISTAGTGIASGNVYTAFFKSNTASKAVVSMLTDIMQMKPIRGRLPYTLKASGPEFVCVKPDTYARYVKKGQLHFDPFQSCKRPFMYGFWARKSRYIFLCDFFFELRLEPASIGPGRGPANTCLQVNRQTNSFVGFGDRTCLYQKYTLIHEMVHFYLGAKTLGLGSRPPEEYDLTKCVRFPQELSLRNPQNYQALVAMVEQRCFDTPDPFREFLSLGGNGNLTMVDGEGDTDGVSLA